MKYVIVENNKVVNAVRAEQPLADNWIQSDTARIGDTYDPENGTFSSIKSLDEQKAELTKQVNAKALEIRWSPVPFTRVVEGGDDISTAVQFRGPDDFINLSALKNAVDNGATEVTVIMEDNNVYTLTASEFNAMWGAGLYRNQLAAVNARSLKNSIESAETVEDLPDITSGWPS